MSADIGIIIGAAGGGVVLIGIGIFVYCKCCRDKAPDHENAPGITPQMHQTPTEKNPVSHKVAAKTAGDDGEPSFRGKVHASFSGEESAPVSMQMQKCVQKAKYDFTGIHHGQTADWFEVWTDKAGVAEVMIIMFSDAYRARFTAALQREAHFIIDLEAKGTCRIFIFDPTKSSAADIYMNLEEDARYMGDVPGWKDFVTRTTPVGPSESSMTVPH